MNPLNVFFQVILKINVSLSLKEIEGAPTFLKESLKEMDNQLLELVAGAGGAEPLIAPLSCNW